MTTETQSSKAARPRREAQPPAQGVEAAAKWLQALSLMPLHGLAEARNQSIPSLLHDMTGLSKARISTGNLDAVRPSTKARIDVHLEATLQEQFKGNPEGLDEFRRKLANAPVTSSGAPAPLAGWVHQFEFLPLIPLPMTKAVALIIDELLEALLTCCRGNNLPGFKTILMRHLIHHGLAVRAHDQVAGEPVPESELAALQSMADWEKAANWTGRLVEHLYWDLISSLDAEWSSHYFAGRQSMPLFPLVMVRPQDGLMETKKVSSRRNIYLKPVRRLLQFLYAMAFYLRHKRWPAKAPSPKALAEIFYRPGSQEVAEESLISNYFDGSTKLTLALALEHWEQLLQHFIPKHSDGGWPNPPFPLIMLALHWQMLLVQDKGRTFLLPDMERYEVGWHYRRDHWSMLQARQNEESRETGQALVKPIEWPVWSLNQSSSLS